MRFIDFIFRHNVLQNVKTKLIIHLYSEVLINVELENAIKNVLEFQVYHKHTSLGKGFHLCMYVMMNCL